MANDAHVQPTRGSSTAHERRSFFDRLIPEELLADTELRFRSRVLIAVSLTISGLLVPVVVIRATTMRNDAGLLILLCAITIALALPALLRLTRSHLVPSYLLLTGALVAFFFTERALGVFPVPALLYYTMVPLAAGFLIGSRAALLFGGLMVLEGTVMYHLYPPAGGPLLEDLAPTFWIILSSGIVMTTLLTLAYERNRRRALDRAHAVAEDLREANHALTHARAQAEDANRAKSDFLARMSHELRTPLNAIIGYAELLAEDFSEEQDEHGEDARRIAHAGKHLLELINEVLDLSKVEAGELEIRLVDIELPSFLESLRGTIEPLARRGGNSFEIELEGELARVHSDPLRLRQILLNLLGNACKFTERGRVVLAIAPDPGDPAWLLFRVHDTGIGMTEEQLASAFKPFVQVSVDPALRRTGTGLGLALTRRLTALLGGEVTATSRANVGSTFTVRLPAADPEQA